MTCEEAEALCLLREEHLAEVAVAETDLAVFGDRAGDAEGLKTDTDIGSGVGSLLVALLYGDGGAHGVCPLCVFKADWLCFLYDGVRVDARIVADLFALVDRGDAVFLENAEDLRLASFVTFKISHFRLLL